MQAAKKDTAPAPGSGGESKSDKPASKPAAESKPAKSGTKSPSQ